MQNISSLYLPLGAIAFVIALFIIFYILKSLLTRKILVLQTQVQSNEVILDEFKLVIEQQKQTFADKQNVLAEWQLEHQQVSQQLEHRIKMLQQQLGDLQILIEQFQQQQPEDRLYSRAQKMVLLGASVEELITECELPKAEAEMLVAMQRKK